MKVGIPINENGSAITPRQVNEVVAGREPACNVGGNDVRDTHAQVLLPLHRHQHAAVLTRSKVGNWVMLSVVSDVKFHDFFALKHLMKYFMKYF